MNDQINDCLEYGKEIVVTKGKLLQFPDFSLLFKDTETRKFVIGGVERSNSINHYEVKYEENGKEIKRQLDWTYGYPGGLAEALGTVTVSNKSFIIKMNHNGDRITVQRT